MPARRPLAVLWLLTAAWSASTYAQLKPFTHDHGRVGWGEGARTAATPAPAAASASRAAAFASGVLGVPFDLRGLTTPGAGWLPGDAGHWSRTDVWSLLRQDSEWRWQAAAASASGANAYFQHYDGSALDTPDTQPQIRVAQGRNSYALPAAVRFCPNLGYYPAVSECKQGWLTFQPEPPR